MGTNLNFNPFVNEAAVEANGTPPGDFPLMRQSSIYSLTFDEFQTNLGKDFGSMNMDELLKSIWSAEETQNSASAAVAGAGGVGNQGVYLQRQGSLSLPRTLSVKTVDEVWRDMSKDFVTGKDTGSGASMPQAQRQPTLGEMTLEDFLMRAGVVREDSQVAGKLNPGGFWGDLGQPNGNDSSFGFSFQQPSHGAGLTGSQIADNNGQISLQSTTNLPLNVNGVRSSQPQPIAPQLQQQPLPRPQPHQQPLFPKQAAVSYAPPIAIPSSNRNQLASPGIRGGVVGLGNPTINSSLAHGFTLQGGGAMGGVNVGLGGGLGVATGSPASLSSDGLKSNGDTPSVSPVPFMFNGGLRGRRSNNTVEKVIERRQKRMIKNRESAARSRARKQAYTTELEEEITKLKEENEELKHRQEKMLEIQKKQAMEAVDALYGAKKRCLRRTHTGPW